MIDIENEILEKLKATLPDVNITNDQTYSPSKFPCVNISEEDNSTYKRTRDSSHNENHALIMYEVNVYSNKVRNAKLQCKQLISVVDDVLVKLGFCRLAQSWFKTNEASITRVTTTYNAVVSKDEVIYRR